MTRYFKFLFFLVIIKNKVWIPIFLSIFINIIIWIFVVDNFILDKSYDQFSFWQDGALSWPSLIISSFLIVITTYFVMTIDSGPGKISQIFSKGFSRNNIFFSKLFTIYTIIFIFFFINGISQITFMSLKFPQYYSGLNGSEIFLKILLFIILNPIFSLLFFGTLATFLAFIFLLFNKKWVFILLATLSFVGSSFLMSFEAKKDPINANYILDASKDQFYYESTKNFISWKNVENSNFSKNNMKINDSIKTFKESGIFLDNLKRDLNKKLFTSNLSKIYANVTTKDNNFADSLYINTITTYNTPRNIFYEPRNIGGRYSSDYDGYDRTKKWNLKDDSEFSNTDSKNYKNDFITKAIQEQFNNIFSYREKLNEYISTQTLNQEVNEFLVKERDKPIESMVNLNTDFIINGLTKLKYEFDLDSINIPVFKDLNDQDVMLSYTMEEKIKHIFLLNESNISNSLYLSNPSEVISSWWKQILWLSLFNSLIIVASYALFKRTNFI